MACVNRLLKSLRLGPTLKFATPKYQSRNMHIRNDLNIHNSLLPSSFLTKNHCLTQEISKMCIPFQTKYIEELPKREFYLPNLDFLNEDTIIEEPVIKDKKEAARMIIIRRKKMKKHKLKKLRKRLKFVRAKIRQRREWKKEKDFQAGLIKLCKEAESFSAEEYVNEKIALYKKVVLFQTQKSN